MLAHERGDPQLALFVARLLESSPGATDAGTGIGGACSRRLVQQDLMPLVKGDACAEVRGAWWCWE